MEKIIYEEPCPNCQRKHANGASIPRPEIGTNGSVPICPPDVTCVCGAVLRSVVPLFKISESGWVWKVVKPAGAKED